MNTNKLLTGALIGGIVSFFLGWLLYGTLFKSTFDSNMSEGARALSKAEPDMVLMVISCLFWGLFIAYIFEKWAGIRTLMSGFTAGLTIGIIYAISYYSGLLAMTTMYDGISNILLNVVVDTVYSGIIGAVVGWWLGYNRN